MSDKLSNPQQDGGHAQQSLYVASEKIYPRAVTGRFRTWRNAVGTVLMVLFFATCWVTLDGRQALLFDLPARQFHIFWFTFYPQDFLYLTALLIIAAVALFLFTAIGGRLWCGYSCPQTAFTELFLWLERVCEGNHLQRRKLDAAPLSAQKFLRKLAKHSAWLMVAFWTGLTFVGYFTPMRELVVSTLTFDVGGWALFWIGFFTFATYGNAGWMREQVCTYMCPYARFQSAMFDRDTLVIAYDQARGEPRKRVRNATTDGASEQGDCVNCTLCVQVCPTGIDIRDGLQFQCIACASCIDICDTVMERVGKPSGLVRYTTLAATEGKTAGPLATALRPRTIGYVAVLLLVISGLLIGVSTRIPLELDVLRDRNALARQLPGGEVQNVFRLRVLNKDAVAHEINYSLQGLEGAKLELSAPTRTVAAGEVVTLAASITIKKLPSTPRRQAFWMLATATQDEQMTVREQVTFLTH